MKPTEAEVKWCIEHRDWINGLLEKRGGWQIADWYWQPEAPEEIYHVQLVEFMHDLDLVWLPSMGDVLGMLEAGGMDRLHLEHYEDKTLGYVVVVHCGPELANMARGATFLIALLELLGAVEGTP